MSRQVNLIFTALIVNHHRLVFFNRRLSLRSERILKGVMHRRLVSINGLLTLHLIITLLTRRSTKQANLMRRRFSLVFLSFAAFAAGFYIEKI
jgi:hypothetical protein